MAKSISSLIKENVLADMISKNKDGNFVFRQGYFYRTSTVDRFAARIQRELEAIGLKASLIDLGDHWAPFQGGKGVKANSHFYAEFNVTKPE